MIKRIIKRLFDIDELELLMKSILIKVDGINIRNENFANNPQISHSSEINSNNDKKKDFKGNQNEDFDLVDKITIKSEDGYGQIIFNHYKRIDNFKEWRPLSFSDGDNSNLSNFFSSISSGLLLPD